MGKKGTGCALAVVVLMVTVEALLLPATGGEHYGRTDAEPNNTFETATTLTGAKSDTGETFYGGLSNTDTQDYYRVDGVAPGMVVNVSLYIENYYTANESFSYRIHVYLYSRDRVQLAWSVSDYQWEACSALAVLGGEYYIRVVLAKMGDGTVPRAYRINVKAAFPPEVTAPAPDNPVVVVGQVFNNSYQPVDWYRVRLNAGDTITVDMTESVARSLDLYFGDLWPETMAWYYNISWWGDNNLNFPYEEVAATATYTGYYYFWVNTFAYGGNYTLILYSGAPITPYSGQFGDPKALGIVPVNNPDDSIPQKARPAGPDPSDPLSNSRIFRNEWADQAFDHYDWFRVNCTADTLDLLGENDTVVNSTLYLTYPRAPGSVFRLSLYMPSFTSGGYDVIGSGTNLKGGSQGPYYDTSVNLYATKGYLERGWPAYKGGPLYLSVMPNYVVDPRSVVNMTDGSASGQYELHVSSVCISNQSNRAPQVKNSPHIIMNENDVNREVKLNWSSTNTGGVFWDPDLDKGDRLTFRVVGTSPYIAVNLSGDADETVELTPQKYWDGEDNITIRATDSCDLTNESTIWVTVKPKNYRPYLVGSLPDLPQVGQPPIIEDNKPAIPLNLSSFFKDPDTEDTLTFTALVPDNSVPITFRGADVEWGIVNRPASGNRTTITFTATDPYGESASGTLNMTIMPVNHPPFRKTAEGKPDPVSLAEGTQSPFKLTDYFTDPDGDALSFSFVEGNSTNLTVTLESDGVTVSLKPSENYYTETPEHLKFVATDTSKLPAVGYVNVTVTPVNDAPRWKKVLPDIETDLTLQIIVNETEKKTFSITVEDIDNTAGQTTYVWSVDGTPVRRLTGSSGAVYTYESSYDTVAHPDTQKEVRISVEFDDGAGGNGSYSWADKGKPLIVKDRNRAPTNVRIIEPENNTAVEIGKTVSLTAFTASDPDGDNLTCTWKEGSKVLGTGTTAKYKVSSKGSHPLTLEVSDGSAAVKSSVVVFGTQSDIRRDPPIPGFEAVLLAAAATAAFGLARRLRTGR